MSGGEASDASPPPGLGSRNREGQSPPCTASSGHRAPPVDELWGEKSNDRRGVTPSRYPINDALNSASPERIRRALNRRVRQVKCSTEVIGVDPHDRKVVWNP
jgi:hypothetical protein